ncbi:MAG: hypothetical protein M3Q75_02785 [Gemmatimonadota bacterium]|nr:hypothetical protein [Gemmatimonadota bacterium]
MSSKSNYLESALLSWIKGTTFPVAPATEYIALFTAAPSDTGGGTEVTGGAYARASITSTTGWSAISDNAGAGRISNSVAITFVTPTANWGLVTHFAVMDSLTVGNQLYWGLVGTSRNILSGDVAPTFAIGTLTIDES